MCKTHLLYGARDEVYGEMWQKAGPKVREYMLFQPMAPNNTNILLPGVLTAVPMGDDGKAGLSTYLNGKTEHLACFIGGHFAISGKLYNNPKDLDVAAKLTNGCVWAYSATKTGIAPDTFSTLSCGATPFDCKWDEQTFTDKLRSPPEGNLPQAFLEIQRKDYTLRPEAIESVFIMWRTTGDPIWREKGWQMFTAIRKATRTKYGHSALMDVMDDSADAPRVDKMESFWLSETLKYFYLLFSDTSLVSLDEWVFNTEAHPFRIQDEHRGYG